MLYPALLTTELSGLLPDQFAKFDDRRLGYSGQVRLAGQWVTSLGFPKMMAALNWARAAVEAHTAEPATPVHGA